MTKISRLLANKKKKKKQQRVIPTTRDWVVKPGYVYAAGNNLIGSPINSLAFLNIYLIK
jgi:hypothetical protein